MNWRKKILYTVSMMGIVLSLANAAWAELVGQAGYDTNNETMETKIGKTFSGGMDLVYAQVASGSAAAKTRSFLKCEDGNWPGTGWSVQVNLYDYKGNFAANFADGINPYGTGQYSIFCTGVKVNPTPDVNGDRIIWFSMSGSTANEGDWYTVTVDSDFTYVVSGPTAQFSQAGNWEVEWNSATGTAFYAGKETNAWTDPHAIYIYAGGLQKVVDVGGHSCGFAIDPDGNLYAGTYTDSGPATQQEVRMYTAAKVQAAVSGNYALTSSDADNIIAIPAINSVYLGTNDLESDPDGNIYITANGSWDATYQSDVGYVFRINAWDSANPPSNMTMIAAGIMDQVNPDWQKQICYDGSSNLTAGGHYDPTDPNQAGNRLYIDQDYSWGSGGPDDVSGLCVDTDGDNDGVPDSLDNAYLTANAGQVDTDQDMYGNICDADFNNSLYVDGSDFLIFRSNYNQAVPPGNPNVDMDGGDYIGPSDFGKFKSRYNSSAPWF